MKEFYDLPYHTFSGFSQMTVRCPKCGGMGTVLLDKESRIAAFRCDSCYFSEERIPQYSSFEVSGKCGHCDRHYRVYLKARKHDGGKLRVACGYCGQMNVGEVTVRRQRYIYAEPAGGRDPYFGYTLYYQDHFRGELVWALNREHLQYLIDYLKADLRKRPVDNAGLRTQSDILPTFMKTAKNRSGIIKLLEKMMAGANCRS